MAHGTVQIPGAQVHKLTFSYNTANIQTGATLYVPTPGDILLDLWIEIVVAWNGTTPLGDVGAFSGGGSALYGLHKMDMTAADIFSGGYGVTIGANFSDVRAQQTVDNARIYLRTQSGSNPTQLETQPSLVHAGYGSRLLPARFANNNDIKVCVSQNGTTSGADPGSSQGQAFLYLVTFTPITA